MSDEGGFQETPWRHVLVLCTQPSISHNCLVVFFEDKFSACTWKEGERSFQSTVLEQELVFSLVERRYILYVKHKCLHDDEVLFIDNCTRNLSCRCLDWMLQSSSVSCAVVYKENLIILWLLRTRYIHRFWAIWQCWDIVDAYLYTLHTHSQWPMLAYLPRWCSSCTSWSAHLASVLNRAV